MSHLSQRRLTSKTPRGYATVVNASLINRVYSVNEKIVCLIVLDITSLDKGNFNILRGSVEKRRQNVMNFYQPGVCKQRWLRMGYKPMPASTSIAVGEQSSLGGHDESA